MVTQLYTLHLSRRVRTMVKGPVRAVAAKGLLFDSAIGCDGVVPDREAIAECLPACYRKAFDKACLRKFSGQDHFHYHLYNSRDKYMNTLHAVPYEPIV